MSWNCLVSFSFGKVDFQGLNQYYVAVHLSLSVFVGFSFDKFFNIFVSEGHKSFAC